MIHPARAMEFETLYAALQANLDAGLVNVTRSTDGLELYCYSRECVYDRKWNDAALMARGLIVDPVRRCVVATPFPKFFNVGERDQTIPALAFETFEKLDGSLIIIFHYSGRWQTATKGSFKSDQAKWAQEWLMARGHRSALEPGTTYLAEAIYPENRIVVHYQESGLVFLAGYHLTGDELSYDEVKQVANGLNTRAARRHSFSSVADLIAHTATLPASEEGFVLRFLDGLRLKVKGEEYRRIHALISRITPLAMWEAMQAGDDLTIIRKQLPEEFWADFDQITTILNNQVFALIADVMAVTSKLSELSNKEVGLMLDTFPERVRHFIFAQRNEPQGLLHGRARVKLFRSIRPTANSLEGYKPSYAMNRVTDEAA